MYDHCCDEMRCHWAEGEVAIVYVAKFREYRIKILDGGSSFQMMRYCPRCGSELPCSLRDEWFDRLEEMGKEPDDDLPEELLSDKWWKSEGL